MSEQASPDSQGVAMLQESGPTARCYPDLFEAQVARTPRRTALTFEDAALSYDELNRRANRLAHLLVSHGASAETVVGIFLERSFDMVVAMLAVQKAGAVCLPLETSYPEERLDACLDDAQAALLVTGSMLLSKLPRRTMNTLCIDRLSSELERQSDGNPVRAIGPGNATQIMFTSGSSGRPKGVTLTHAGLTNFLLAMIDTPGMNEHDVILALANYTFDPSMVEIYQPLIVGAKCVLIPRAVAVDGLALWERVKAERPTILNGTPATFKMLIEAGWNEDFPKMQLICGGETMSPLLAEQLLRRGSSLWNVYGPTETTALCALHRVVQAEEPIPIGRAMPNMRLHVMDETGCPVAPGEAGELYIGGVCVTRGYCRRDDLTHEKFVPDPYDLNPAARLYRSGDRARVRPDGAIELLGRVDDQIKLNGYRIELGGIEATLCRHPAVRHAMVAVRANGEERRLVAFVETAHGTPALEAILREFIAKYLPDYMIPAVFVFLDALPLNANAKLDRQALMAMPLPLPQRTVDAPRDAVEIKVLGVFQDILQHSSVGVEDAFSTLGLDSLGAVRVVRGLERTLGLTLPMSLLLRARNIRQLATALRERLGPAA